MARDVDAPRKSQIKYLRLAPRDEQAIMHEAQNRSGIARITQAEIMYAVLYRATNGFTDFSILDTSTAQESEQPHGNSSGSFDE